ncbi:2OG-Fe(II) oxygenase [Synechococcus phage S-H9-1]|uniref:2OG-Fe(II) oxygenase n=1 Tax=Synechococcus phage S-H9-1 TaxID=2783674 RepID=A0A873WT36_9CAUD|nr:2OG-Fe(II) oxygenase [Synechococcus phage S-H9-1]QPB08264.1 2OG-Fe(II) oxygenase [Synechococcus phage S-H9-1]
MNSNNLIREIEFDDFGNGGVHNDFIHEDFIDTKICDELLDYYENCSYLKKKEGFVTSSGASGSATTSNRKVSMDLCSHVMLADTESSLSNYFNALNNVVQNYFNKYQFALVDCSISPMFNIQKYPPEGGYKVWHFERTPQRSGRERHLVWMTYLTDHIDGGTEFYYQSRYFEAKKGSTLIWPADWTHTHRSRVHKTEEKAIITGWIDLD